MRMRQACIEGRREDAEAAFENLERGDDDRWRTQTWLGLKILGRDAEASRILMPIAESSSPYQLASTLGYAVFDPTPYPELMRILEREGVLRPPPRELPYKCPPPDETSIAVLPFANMSEDQDYFADGISEEILNALAQVPDLKVAGRTSSFAFKGRNEDLRTIGEALGVNHILEGSVRKSGDRVRITAQLIKADDGFHLWSETFDRQLTDVFAIQDEIATAILGELETRLIRDQAPSAAKVDLAAYEDFLHARQLILLRSEAALEQAAALLDDVIAKAPDYAPAYAQRATAELMLADRPSAYGSRDPMETTVTAERLARQALELDPELADAHAVLGLAWSNRGQRGRAEEALRRALALNPNHVNANNWLGLDLAADNRLREALRVRERVAELDPLYAPGIGNLAALYHTMGEHERADALIERVLPFVEGSVRDYVQAAVIDASFWNQEEARAVKLTEELGDRDPWFAKFVTAIALIGLGEYERALSYGADRSIGILALARLGRLEEALARGREFLAGGEGLRDMIRILSAAERHEELVAFYESRFDSLDDLISVTEFSGQGAELLGDIALAHRALDDEAGFRTARDALREMLEQQGNEGADNRYYSWSRAYLAMLQGDHEAALSHMERAVEQGFLETPDFTKYWAAFRPLRGEPRLEALIERMTQRRNMQRALLDLPPFEADT
jgi:TolB-like protein